MIKRKAIFTLASLVFVPSVQQPLASLSEVLDTAVEVLKETVDSTNIAEVKEVNTAVVAPVVEVEKEFVEVPTI